MTVSRPGSTADLEIQQEVRGRGDGEIENSSAGEIGIAIISRPEEGKTRKRAQTAET